MSSTLAYETAPCPVTCFPYVWGMHERYADESRWLCVGEPCCGLSSISRPSRSHAKPVRKLSVAVLAGRLRSTCTEAGCGMRSSCDRGRGVFTLSKHGRPLDWAVVAQEVWRWPDSQVNVDADVWQACLHSLCPSKGVDALRLDPVTLTGRSAHPQLQRPASWSISKDRQTQTAATAANESTPGNRCALGRRLLLPVATHTSPARWLEGLELAQPERMLPRPLKHRELQGRLLLASQFSRLSSKRSSCCTQLL